MKPFFDKPRTILLCILSALVIFLLVYLVLQRTGVVMWPVPFIFAVMVVVATTAVLIILTVRYFIKSSTPKHFALKAFFNKSRTIAFCIFAILVLLLITAILLAVNGWYLMSWQLVYYLLVLAVTLSGLVFLILAARYGIKNTGAKRGVTIALSIASAIIMPIVMFVAGLYLLAAPFPLFVESSPNGQNRVVVMRGGWMETSFYYAYSLYGIFYKEQDNGSLGYVDYAGITREHLQVEWISDDEAVVSIDLGKEKYQEFDDNNEDGVIRVLFD